MYDIVVFVETNLSPAISSSELGFHNYNIYRRDRSISSSNKICGGGVLVAVRSNMISGEVYSPYNNLEALFITIGSGSQKFLLCAAYIPPNQPSSCYSDFSDAVLCVTSTCGMIDSTVIIGDFNLPNCKWNQDQDVGLTGGGRILRDLSSLLDLHQISHIMNSMNVQLDLVFSSSPSNHGVALSADPLLPFEKIHPALSISIKRSSCTTHGHNAPVFLPNLNRCNLEGVKNELIGGYLEFEQCDDLIDFERFLVKLGGIIKKYSPLKRAGPSCFPRWFSDHLKELVIWKKTLHRKYKESLSDSDYYRFSRIREQCKRITEECRLGYVEHLDNTIPSNMKVFWAFVNDLKKSKPTPGCMRIDGQTATEPDEICNLFADFFKSVYTPVTDCAPVYDFNTHLSISKCSVSLNEVKKKLLGLDTSKGAGPDGITPAALKHCCNELAPVLTKMFNVSLRNGIFPPVLKHSYVVPIFKSGDSSDIRNYRPIVIQSAVGKVFESLVLDSIQPCFKQILIDEQHGFTAGRSTVTNLLLFQSYILDAFGRGNQVEAIYIDFAKAFDKVDHGHLLAKLRGYGFVGDVWLWLKSYLEDRTLAVKYATGVSSTFIATSGVPQGSHLGPFLFLLFINDIGNGLGVDCLLFADDVKLYREIKSEVDLASMQDALYQLSRWCESNQMLINPVKSKHITFYRLKNPMIAHFYLDGVRIERCGSVGDLGVVLDSALDFSLHIEGICSKASRMLGFVLRTSRFGLSALTLAILYKALVRPNLEYASSIWSPYQLGQSDRLQSIQRRFVKALGLREGFAYRDVPVPEFEEYLGLLPLTSRRVLADLVVVYKIINGVTNCPPLLRLINIRVPSSNTRAHHLFEIGYMRTNYLLHSPLPRMQRAANRMCNEVDFFSDSMGALRRSFLSSAQNFGI